jgi:hypothetical protein
MSLVRWIGIVCAVSGLLIALPNSPALAVGEASGTGSITFGPEGSGTVTWNAASRTVTITTKAGALAGKCLTTWFDWYTNGAGHYDARAVRVCRSNTSFSHTWSGENSKVAGVQKLAVCYGANNQSGSCKVDPRAVGAGGSPSFCNSTTYSFTVPSSGAVKECTGGDPTKP